MIESVQKVASLAIGGATKSLTDISSSVLPGATGITPGLQTGMSFADVLSDMTKGAIDNIRTAEVKSFEGIKGTASTREVVDAVLSAEQSLQTALALRDKLVSAYLDITKMQI